MTIDPTEDETSDPTNTGSSSTAPLSPGDEAEAAAENGTDNAEGGQDAENLNLTPQGLSDEPAKEEDPDSLVKPDNS